ncbi:uncharacterized protein [Haliotis asinina]|uniref:uncharacterized protein n=1 Tax=Haliotis asinina TaxID=109174 RepID=UPI003531D6DF
MLLSITELILTLSCIVVQDRTHVKAANIMLGKPSRLSTTYSAGYLSGNANDGSRTGPPVHTGDERHPFWQGDLQGFYTVHNITVSSHNSQWWYQFIRDAYIGVSSVDADCTNDDITWCGKWPAGLSAGASVTFTCSHEQPVRFVRVWRNITDFLAVSEVEVQGTPRGKYAAKYDRSLNKKLSTPVTAVNAISASDCGSKCHVTQPCICFSYNPSASPSCLLGTSTETTTANSWVTYSISPCSRDLACGISAQTMNMSSAITWS